jgi:predicted Fe-Mo cluster-binding NifX family protein
MRIAVASKSGTEVDQHFGHAERFLIYDFHRGEAKLLEEVAVEKYCSFDEGHPFRKNQFMAIVEAVAGCKAVITAMIGDYPRQELVKQGIEAVTAEGPIDAALRSAHATLCGCDCAGKDKCSG